MLMTVQVAYLLALLLGALAGLRAMAAPAAVSWAAHLGWLKVQGTWLAFFGRGYTPWILTLFAIGELIADQLPSTPSRKMPVPFAARVLSGGLCGAALGMSVGAWAGGFVIGALGAVIGTLGGYQLRRRLAEAFHKDRPAALIEDAGVIGGLLLVVLAIASLA
jgi:uncharacterized membrane protein